ncbi:ABC transporter permease subunit [Curtobacterium sp. MCJR17_043]|uniref:ABC transporter permease n=1 Tax=Curtobacterium sp. MCJR17_043 TaxID=2175660 RepID=UPI0032E8827C
MIIGQAFAWVLDPANYPGPNGIPVRLWEHVWISLVAVVIAAVIAVPIGYLIGHTGRARGVAIALSGGVRALPTLGVLTLFGLLLGVNLQAPLLALVILAIPSVLAGAYAGIESVDPVTVDAARAQGMTGWQILTKVEIPPRAPTARRRHPCRRAAGRRDRHPRRVRRLRWPRRLRVPRAQDPGLRHDARRLRPRDRPGDRVRSRLRRAPAGGGARGRHRARVTATLGIA